MLRVETQPMPMPMPMPHHRVVHLTGEVGPYAAGLVNGVTVTQYFLPLPDSTKPSNQVLVAGPMIRFLKGPPSVETPTR